MLVLQGLSMAAVIMLFLNLWTTQDNTIYNFAAAGCNLLRTGKRKTVTWPARPSAPCWLSAACTRC